MSSTVEPLPPPWDLVARRSLVVGGGALPLGLLIAGIWPGVFFPAYLAAYLFWLGIALGSLAALTLHYLVGGGWGFLIRRPLEAAVMTFPLLALLFLPLLLGRRTLYPWTSWAVPPPGDPLHFKARYLSLGFWLARAVVYFSFWCGLALVLNRGARRQDETVDPSPTWRLQTISAPGLMLHFLLVTFAMIDWGMSIEPHWFSTIYGPMLFVGHVLSALSARAIVATLLRNVRPLSDLAGPNPFHDVGNLILAFTMLWAYMAFSQYLIIWSGNLTEEIPWYLARSAGAWRYFCILLMVFHFFVPFFLLLSREFKRDPSYLWRAAALLLVMHLFNNIWLIVPAFGGGLVTVRVAVLVAVGIGGLWVAVFVRYLRSRPLLPTRHDPLLVEVLEHEGVH